MSPPIARGPRPRACSRTVARSRSMRSNSSSVIPRKRSSNSGSSRCSGRSCTKVLIETRPLRTSWTSSARSSPTPARRASWSNSPRSSRPAPVRAGGPAACVRGARPRWRVAPGCCAGFSTIVVATERPTAFQARAPCHSGRGGSRSRGAERVAFRSRRAPRWRARWVPRLRGTPGSRRFRSRRKRACRCCGRRARS